MGPLLGVGLVHLWDVRAVQLALMMLAIAAAAWVSVSLPTIEALPRRRSSLADMVGQLTERSFVVPTLMLSTTTAMLGVAVGFLPLLVGRIGAAAWVGAASVALMALVSVAVQPRVGGWHDRGRLSARVGGSVGLVAAAVALLVALLGLAGFAVVAAALSWWGLMPGRRFGGGKPRPTGEVGKTRGMGKQIVVAGAVIVRDGLILCAQRGEAGSLAGLWEFPGGKLEPGETARQALVREISEELHCTITVGEQITTTTHEYDFGTVSLTTYWCELIDGEPELTEHAAVEWRSASELATLDWAPADVPTVDLVVAQ